MCHFVVINWHKLLSLPIFMYLALSSTKFWIRPCVIIRAPSRASWAEILVAHRARGAWWGMWEIRILNPCNEYTTNTSSSNKVRSYIANIFKASYRSHKAKSSNLLARHLGGLESKPIIYIYHPIWITNQNGFFNLMTHYIITS